MSLKTETGHSWHLCAVVNFSFFYRYFDGFCSSELSSIILLILHSRLLNQLEKLVTLWHPTSSNFILLNRSDQTVVIAATTCFPRNAKSADDQAFTFFLITRATDVYLKRKSKVFEGEAGHFSRKEAIFASCMKSGDNFGWEDIFWTLFCSKCYSKVCEIIPAISVIYKICLSWSGWNCIILAKVSCSVTFKFIQIRFLIGKVSVQVQNIAYLLIIYGRLVKLTLEVSSQHPRFRILVTNN